MADSTTTTASDTPAKKGKAETSSTGEPAKARFSRALDEAKAGAQQLGKEAQERADLYREKLTATGGDWVNEAKSKTGQAKDAALDLANEGKTRASGAIASLGKLVEDNAALVDEKVGVKYGDYARKAAASMQSAATTLDEKDLGQLGEDAKEFVRKSPGLAIGIAAVAGFMVARMFKGSID